MESSCKTRDGVIVEIDKEYYRENGEIVHVCGIVERKSTAIVYSYIEGTAMDCRLYQNGYTEIEIPYEHESEEFTIPCSQLYSEPPVFVIEPRIKTKQKELEDIAERIGIAIVELKKVRQEFESQKQLMEKEYSELTDKINSAKNTMRELAEKLV